MTAAPPSRIMDGVTAVIWSQFGLMAAGFTVLAAALFRQGDRIDRLGDRIDARTDALAERIDARTDALAERIDARTDALAARIDAQGVALGIRIDATNQRLDDLLAQQTRFPDAGR